MKELLRKLTVTAKDENGADAVEYAALIMVVGGLFAAVAGVIGGHSGEIGDVLSNVIKTWISQMA